ncbi:MAG: 6-phosphofructokinase [Planctomycetes bacterium]|nr:6-phosphofructokinase [Planctomycetota bacterium]
MTTTSSGTDAQRKGTVAIVVGGGPAPGINGVIGASTIEAINRKHRVLGVVDGFRRLSAGDATAFRELTIDVVSRIHFQGGSLLGISRHNPTGSPEEMDRIVKLFADAGVRYLVTIGGDDTAYTASQIERRAAGQVKVAHVPKTIDNDLPLPGNLSTFGYQTARHIGCNLLQNIMEDSRTTRRWYIIVAMGRKAGHLALGIGKAAGCTITIIAEEFGRGPVPLARVTDTIEGAIIKRRSMGREDGVCMVSEGVIESIRPEDLKGLEGVEHDPHGHLRFSEINFGQILRNQVRKSLTSRGIKATIVAKDIGYELRCAPPIPFDCEYTRNLGYAAVKFLLEGGSGAMINLVGGRMVPLWFEEMLDPTTGRTRVRLVDTNTEAYEVARKYMIRLGAEDFLEPGQIQRLADAAKLTREEFERRFRPLTE